MIEQPAVLTIKKPSRRPTKAQLAAFEGAASSVVSDAMFGVGAMSSQVSHIDRHSSLPKSVVGPAVTVDAGAGDLLAAAAALKFLQSGDVMVVAFDGYQGRALLGDRMSGMLMNIGAAAVVTDGPLRDLEGIIDAGLPAWCSGLTPASPFFKGPGSVGLPINVGGQQVETGDIIVADLDGVTVVPFDKIDETIASLQIIMGLEGGLDEAIQNGQTTFADVDALLASDQVKYVD